MKFKYKVEVKFYGYWDEKREVVEFTMLSNSKSRYQADAHALVIKHGGFGTAAVIKSVRLGIS